MRIGVILEHLRKKGWRHWLVFLGFLSAGIYLGQYLSESRLWTDLRYGIYQRTFAFAEIRGPLYPKRTVLVFVGDDEYWSERLAGRSPIKRDYLADLVARLDAAEAAAIALDFDLRSPRDGRGDFEEYADETRALAGAVARAIERRPVILPATVGFDKDGDYVRQASVLDRFELHGTNLHFGFIQLPYDLRRVPLSLELGDGTQLDSFALAIARSVDAEAFRRVSERHMNALPFTSYMTAEAFADANAVLPADEVLSLDDDTLRSRVAHRLVIVGGAWSARAHGVGGIVDLHPSPAGRLSGALLHANYVEAILGERTYKPVSSWLIKVIEIALLLTLAGVAALELPSKWKWLSIVGSCSVLILLSYFLLQNLGIFMEFFVPALVIAGHILLEQILEWRAIARERLSLAHAGANPAHRRHP